WPWLLKVDCLKAKASQHGSKRATRVLRSRIQNVVGQGSLLQLALRFLANLGLQVGIDTDEQTGLSGIHTGLRTIQARGKDLWSRKVEMKMLAFRGNIAGFEGGKVDSGHRFAVNDHKQPVTRKEIGENAVLTRARDYLVHGVLDGFKTF